MRDSFPTADCKQTDLIMKVYVCFIQFKGLLMKFNSLLMQEFKGLLMQINGLLVQIKVLL